MAKIYFLKTVRYEGIKYAPNTPFDAAKKDIDELVKVGGFLVEPDKVEKAPKAKEPKEKANNKPDDKKK